MSEPISDFIRYMTVVKGRSKGTAEQYRIDLTLLFKFVYSKRNGLPLSGEEFDGLSIEGLGYDFAGSIKRSEIMDFLVFVSDERGNGAKTRARKLSSIRGFYRYNVGVEHVLKTNPAENIDRPKIPKSLPKYLTVDESRELLEAAYDDESKFSARNFAILTVFLNCGIRLSELVGIDLNDIDKDMTTLRVRGKGAKERIVYLNDACREALSDYLKVRDRNAWPGHENALFLSSRRRRISKQMVQVLAQNYFRASGLGNRGFTVHKLRHTAATLMYQTGKVDIRVLKDILGHEQLNTTQIYTHLSDESMQKAMNDNPLAEFKTKKND